LNFEFEGKIKFIAVTNSSVLLPMQSKKVPSSQRVSN